MTDFRHHDNSASQLNAMSLKQNLGINQAPRPMPDSTSHLYIINLPIIGRIQFLKDKLGIQLISGIVAYWIYGVWSSYFVIIKPHYADGLIYDWYIYYHFLVAILCLISLFRASTLNPGSLPIVDDAYADSHKWELCKRCYKRRPPLAHHCTRCNQCVVRMDHHCPWINNCVGEGNHHVFLLLLFYAFLFGFNTTILLLLHFWYWPKCTKCDTESILVVHGIWFHYLSFLMAAAMAFFMSSQYLGHHCNILIDRTTLENMKTGLESIEIEHGYLIAREFLAIQGYGLGIMIPSKQPTMDTPDFVVQEIFGFGRGPVGEEDPQFYRIYFMPNLSILQLLYIFSSYWIYDLL